MLNIVVLVSGGGTNLQALIDAQAKDELGGGRICAVVSSKEDVYALRRARDAGIPAHTVRRKSYADIGDFSRAAEAVIAPYQPGLIVHAGFLSVMDAQFCRTFPWQINIHPALIPSFCGKGMYGIRVHEAALERGVKISGATVHFVDEVADGGPIIMQKAVRVEDDETPESLQLKIMEQCERLLLPRAVALFCAGRLTVRGGRVIIEECKEGTI